MVSFIKPHHPFDAPEKWKKLYDPETLELLPGWTDTVPELDYLRSTGYFDNAKLSEKCMQEILASYYASIAQIDHWLAEMVRLLKHRKLYEDTMIIFTADHGDYMGFHHMILKNNHMYDPIVKVPLLLKYAGCSAPKRSNHFCSHTDLFSTVLHECGIVPPDHTPGRHLNSEEWLQHTFSMQLCNGKPEYMIRTNRYKLILSDEFSLLFDMENDPDERYNLADQSDHAQILAELRELLMRHILFNAPPVPFYPAQPTHTESEKQRIDNRKSYFHDQMLTQSALTFPGNPN